MAVRRHLAAVLVTAALGVGLGVGLAGCAEADAASGEEATLGGEVAKVEAVEGSSVSKVSLSPEAGQRLGIATAPVRIAPVDGKPRTVVPYSAVIYDADGTAYAFTNPEPNTYLRAPLNVAAVRGDLAVVQGGPPVGTPVVTVGAAELFGTETGVGDE